MSGAKASHLPWASTPGPRWPEAARAPGPGPGAASAVARACAPRTPRARAGRAGATLWGLVFLPVATISNRIEVEDELRQSMKEEFINPRVWKQCFCKDEPKLTNTESDFLTKSLYVFVL